LAFTGAARAIRRQRATGAATRRNLQVALSNEADLVTRRLIAIVLSRTTLGTRALHPLDDVRVDRPERLLLGSVPRPEFQQQDRVAPGATIDCIHRLWFPRAFLSLIVPNTVSRQAFAMLTRVTPQIAIVPHQYLYERTISLPSTCNPDHRRFYMTATPLIEKEDALEPNRCRIRHLADSDLSDDYSIPPGRHRGGCDEIGLMIPSIQESSLRLHTGNSLIRHDSMDQPLLASPRRSVGDECQVSRRTDL